MASRTSKAPAAAGAAAAAAAAAAARVCRALGHPERLRLVALLAHAEVGVGALQRALGLRQANTSRHLAVLRGAEVVAARRDGGRVYYRLGSPADPGAAAVLRAVIRAVAASARI
jgi:ArsR family transcriptional regulator